MAFLQLQSLRREVNLLLKGVRVSANLNLQRKPLRGQPAYVIMTSILQATAHVTFRLEGTELPVSFAPSLVSRPLLEVDLLQK